MNPDSDTAVLASPSKGNTAAQSQHSTIIRIQADSGGVEQLKQSLLGFIKSSNPPQHIVICFNGGDNLELASAYRLLRPLASLFRDSRPINIEIEGVPALCDDSFRAQGILTSLGLPRAQSQTQTQSNNRPTSPLPGACFDLGRKERTGDDRTGNLAITENTAERSTLIVYRDTVSDDKILRLLNSLDPSLREITIDLRGCSHIAHSTLKAVQCFAINKCYAEVDGAAPVEVSVTLSIGQEHAVFENSSIKAHFNQRSPKNLKVSFD